MLQKRFISDFFSYGMLGVLSKFISLFTLPLYAAYLRPEDFGILEISIFSSSILSMILSFQIESALLRMYFDKEDDFFKKALFSTGLFFNILTSLFSTTLFLIFFYYFDCYLFISTEITYSVVFLAISQLVFMNIYGYSTVALRVKYERKNYILLNSVQALTNIGLGLLMIVYFNYKVEGILLSNLITMAIFSFVALYLNKNLIIKIFKINLLKEMLVYSIPLIPSSLMLYAQQYLVRIVILSKLSILELGLYVIASKLASPLLLVVGTIKVSWMPLAFENHDSLNAKKNFNSLLLKYLQYGSFILCTLSIFSKEAIEFLFDKRYIDSYKLVGLIAFSFYLRGINNMISPGLGVAKKSFLLSISTVIGIAISIGLMYYLVNDYGTIGLLYGAIFGEIIAVVILLYFTEKYFSGFFNYFFVALGILSPLCFISLYDLFQLNIFAKNLVLVIFLFFIVTQKKWACKCV